MKRIPIAGPWITQREIDYVTDAVTHGWYERAGEYPARFEQAFAGYLGVKHAISLPSCTSGLHLALASLDVGPGDEVIVPDVTWIATSAPIAYVQAQPVFADIEERTWCLSPASFESCITPRTRAVIAVDLYGNAADFGAIEKIAAAHGIAVIEDAAEAVGGGIGDRRTGSFGDASAFSFHGSKTLTTGEGGLLATNRDDIHERALMLRDHGRPPGDNLFCNTEVAFKYKMSALQAALGLAQLERIDELISRKRQIFAWYHEELADLDGVTLNFERSETTSTFWMITVVWSPSLGLAKLDLMDQLRERGVDSRPFFHPLSSLEAYAGNPEADAARERNRTAYDISSRALNLPSALNLTRKDVSFVCGILKSILAGR